MNTPEIIKNNGLHLARMVCFSKSSYRNKYPDNDVIFNANIFTESSGKVWYGDLDLTLEEDVLKKIAKEVGEPLYVLREHDGRFENENLEIEKVKETAHKIIEP